MASIYQPTKLSYCPVSYWRLRRRPSIRTANPLCMHAKVGDMSSKALWALDFDGVICDSCGESSLSAWKAAEALWPQKLQTPEAIKQKPDILQKMRIVRPVVETGYENIIQIRLLLEGTSTDDMLQHWSSILQQSMEKWQLNRAEVDHHTHPIGSVTVIQLVELFGSTRDQWMEEDLKGWLAPNEIFDGIPAAMKTLMQTTEVYIVTTKQARFTDALLRDMADVEFPKERIISTTVSGTPKTEILHQLQERHPNHGYHFIEDKLSTLHKVCQDDGLIQWCLYFADWGYNTQQERDSVKDNPRLQLVSLLEFVSMMTSQAM